MTTLELITDLITKYPTHQIWLFNVNINEICVLQGESPNYLQNNKLRYKELSIKDSRHLLTQSIGVKPQINDQYSLSRYESFWNREPMTVIQLK